MSNIFKEINWKKTGIFAAGVAFGTAGIKAEEAVVTGEGTYTVSLDFTETAGKYATSFVFAAIGIYNGEKLFPGYTNCTAAALRAKDFVMKTVSTVQENAEDIYADAKSINEERALQQEQEFAADAQEASEDAE